jgi:transposase
VAAFYSATQPHYAAAPWASIAPPRTSHEVVVLNCATVTVKVAQMRLCHRRMISIRAYPRDAQEMVFDAHDRAFAFFKGACQRGIHDNMKTAIETVFAGKNRLFNRRFAQMCTRYLIELFTDDSLSELFGQGK